MVAFYSFITSLFYFPDLVLFTLCLVSVWTLDLIERLELKKNADFVDLVNVKCVKVD